MTRDEQWLLDEKYGGYVNAPGFTEDCKRLAAGEPLAYLIGSQPFLGLTIHLDSHPLIPRPETEWWTEQMLREAGEAPSVVRLGPAARSATEGASPAKHSLSFLDLCAGSGAIGCAALARLPHAHISFGEIDPAHKSTIEKNIYENGLDMSRADIRIGDLFEPFTGERFDVIAANPPYIPVHRALDTSVVDYEPHEALFAGDDGLSLIGRIANNLADHLAPDGVAWIEVDTSHADAARDLFTAQGFAAEIRTDQYDAPRVIVVSWP